MSTMRNPLMRLYISNILEVIYGRNLSLRGTLASLGFKGQWRLLNYSFSEII